MTLQREIVFDPFRLDVANERLWKGAVALPLRPKGFAVLRYLADRPGQLVTKEELLNAVWPETFVGEAVLKVSILQLREALEDDARKPRFIETVHRRGYRFIGRITAPNSVSLVHHINNTHSNPTAVQPWPAHVVGRNQTLAQIHTLFQKARSGERQIVFVTGEAGIGKTTIVDAFVHSLPLDQNILVGQGQCLEHFGAREAYLPVFEALTRLCRGKEGDRLLKVLRTCAPTWLLQMPSLVSVAEREAIRRDVLGATRERMLREMAEALEAIASEQPLVLILEDLHWSDYSTLDLISSLSRRTDGARLMLIGTYRTMELIVGGHPLKALKQELVLKQQCREVSLEYLSQDAITVYLSVRFPGHRFPPALAALIHQRTEGNPLFMVNTVDYLLNQRLIGLEDGRWQLAEDIEKINVGVPDSIKDMIESQIDHLAKEDQRMLEAASISGVEFSAQVVAIALEEDIGRIEDTCDQLTRRHQFVRDCGSDELPNGKTAVRYAFTHALYQSALYERVPLARRVEFHRRIGEQQEELYGERAAENATELALHFERGRDYRRAVKYLELAIDTSVRRFAYQDAISLAGRGLKLLHTLPETPERIQQELRLHIALGVPLTVTQGYAAPEVGRTYAKARELCERLGDTPELFQVLWGLRGFYTVRAELDTAHEFSERILRLAQRTRDPELLVRGHLAMQATLMQVGEFSRALSHFEQLLSLDAPQPPAVDAARYVLNPASASRCFAAWSLHAVGMADQALIRVEEAVALARQSSDPHTLTHALFFAAALYQFRREERLTKEHAEAAIALSTEHGLLHYLPQARITRGWALVEQGRHQEGVEEIRDGLAAYEQTGAKLAQSHLQGLLADALGKTGAPEEGLKILADALAGPQHRRSRYYDAELYRLKGELTLMQVAGRDTSRRAINLRMTAERCFHDAIHIAREQRAISWELRALLSLLRLYDEPDKSEEVRHMLEEIFGQFSEGFDTHDLKQAKDMLRAPKSRLISQGGLLN